MSTSAKIVAAAREASRAYFDFHAKFQIHSGLFGQESAAQSIDVEKANIEIATAMFNLKQTIEDYDRILDAAGRPT